MQQGNQLICPGPVLLLGQACYGHPGGVPQLLPRIFLQGIRSSAAACFVQRGDLPRELYRCQIQVMSV